MTPLPPHPRSRSSPGSASPGGRWRTCSTARGVPFVVVELNPATVRRTAKAGLNIMHGDAAEDAVLVEAGIARATLLALAIPDDAAVLRAIDAARRLNPADPHHRPLPAGQHGAGGGPPGGARRGVRGADHRGRVRPARGAAHRRVGPARGWRRGGSVAFRHPTMRGFPIAVSARSSAPRGRRYSRVSGPVGRSARSTPAS